jgi:L-methionine (R)-S-oxide reductase
MLTGQVSQLPHHCSSIHPYISIPLSPPLIHLRHYPSTPPHAPAHNFHPPNPGFYVLDPTTDRQLILGPFHGKVACQTITFSRGVCGLAASTQETQLVPDVDIFPGHIACDGASKSELVVPVVRGGQTVAVIDIDCATPGAFDDVDKYYLQILAGILAAACDW